MVIFLGAFDKKERLPCGRRRQNSHCRGNRQRRSPRGNNPLGLVEIIYMLSPIAKPILPPNKTGTI